MDSEIAQSDIDKLEDLYASEGWKVLAADIEERKKAVEQHILGGLKDDEYRVAIGHLRAYAYVLAGPIVLEQVKKQQQADPEIELP